MGHYLDKQEKQAGFYLKVPGLFVITQPPQTPPKLPGNLLGVAAPPGAQDAGASQPPGPDEIQVTEMVTGQEANKILGR